MHKLFVILLTVCTPALLSVPTGALPIPDSVNGDGVFSNTLTSNGILKILNRPNVDVHVDSDSSVRLFSLLSLTRFLRTDVWYPTFRLFQTSRPTQLGQLSII